MLRAHGQFARKRAVLPGNHRPFVGAQQRLLHSSTPYNTAETVYFNESCDTARKAVQEVLERYDAVLGRLRWVHPLFAGLAPPWAQACPISNHACLPRCSNDVLLASPGRVGFLDGLPAGSVPTD